MGFEDPPPKLDPLKSERSIKLRYLIFPTLIIFLPVLWHMYFTLVYLPQPSYSVSSYHKLAHVCTPAGMALPSKDFFSSDSAKYTIYLETRQRSSSPVGFYITQSSPSEFGTGDIFYSIYCRNQAYQDFYTTPVARYNDVSIYGHFEKADNMDSQSHQANRHSWYLSFQLGAYQYNVEVEVRDPESDVSEDMRALALDLAHSVIDYLSNTA